ncbi:MAG: hypothetical protein K2W99_02825 [Chthoniobacterales bacterium]|nr:hypothetical protein [Chthoniobacterales bacterium]
MNNNPFFPFFLRAFLFLMVSSFSGLVLQSYAQSQDPEELREEVAQSPNLTDKQLYHIGIKIWQNQCGLWNLPDNKSGITPEMKQETTAWEDDEGGNSFALMGAFQFIWYPQEGSHDFFEDWPLVAKELQKKGYPIEDWILGPCPWKSREEFMAPENFEGDKMTLLRKVLTKKPLVIEQTRLVAQRAEEALPKILQAIDEDETVKDKELTKQVVTERYRVVAATNFYAIMDYVHFKGEGILKTERNDLRPNGWGLRQVLETMDPGSIRRFHYSQLAYLKAFIVAAISIYPDQDHYNCASRYVTYLNFSSW